MESSKTKLESNKTISNVTSPFKLGMEGAKTARSAPTERNGMLRCFQRSDGEVWRSKQFMPKVQSVLLGSEGGGAEIEISGKDIDNPQVIAKKFHDFWYIMEIGKSDLTCVNGVPARQAVLTLDTSTAMTIGDNQLVCAYTSKGDETPSFTAGTPGKTDFHLEDTKGVKYPFTTDSACLMGANPICALCTGADRFLQNFVAPPEKPVFEQEFIGVFSVLDSRLMFASFDERLILDGKSAESLVSVSDGSELSVGSTTIKLRVPSELTGMTPVGAPDSLGESILALLPVSDPDGTLPDIEIPSAIRSITIGRSSKVSDVVILEANLSRKHAQCIIYDKNIMIFDCGSSNGTFVNGEKITKKTIHPGDVISFGDIAYFFCYA